MQKRKFVVTSASKCSWCKVSGNATKEAAEGVNEKTRADLPLDFLVSFCCDRRTVFLGLGGPAGRFFDVKELQRVLNICCSGGNPESLK